MSELMGNYAQYGVAFVRGEGSYLYDASGNKYLDCGCGISVTNLGHVHPHVTKRLKEQADTLWHTSNLFSNALPERLSDRLSEATFGGKLFLCNSGAEANECAIKLARIYNNKICGGRKSRIITMVNGFHGRTYATLSATGQDKVHHGFEPIAPFFTYIPFNDIKALEAEMAKGDVGAVMLELYQGESGVLPAETEFVKAVRELTSATNALMMLDEVQTGYGRTGKLFAYPHFNIIPDVITMAKAMANGIPMGGVLAKPEFAALLTPGTHGSTFGANLIACAAAEAVLDIILEKGFMENITLKGDKLQNMLRSVLSPYGAAVRGCGMMIGVDIGMDNKDFIKKALSEKLVVIGGGSTSIRFYMPLNASEPEMAEGVEKIEKIMKSFRGKI